MYLILITVDYYGTITHEDSNTGEITIEGAWYVLKEDSGMISETADELIYPISAYAVWETAWNTYPLDSMYNYMY